MGGVDEVSVGDDRWGGVRRVVKEVVGFIVVAILYVGMLANKR